MQVPLTVTEILMQIFSSISRVIDWERVDAGKEFAVA